MRVLVTRPRQDGEAVARLLAAMGHQALLAPLLETHFFDGPEPDLAGVQAILATSANGVRALARRTARRDVPVFAVGPQTSAEAGALGFADVRNADGDARDLAVAAARWAVPSKGALLHVCGAHGESTLAQALPGFELRRVELYDVQAVPALPQAVRGGLATGAVDAALFFSPRSARIFCGLAQGLAMTQVIAAAISPVTAKALAPLAFREVRVAARPNQDALLALL